MEDFKFYLGILFSMGLLLLLLVVIIGYCDYRLSRYQCRIKSEALGYDYNYKYLQGCLLINSSGKKILLEQLRDMDF